MYNKKAQSQIITTILIILLVLAAIIIVWQVIQGTVQEGADEIESQSSCLGLRLEITNIAVTTDTDSASITIRPTKNISGWEDNNGPGIKIEEDYVANKGSGNLSLTLEKEEYFVMGDNRMASLDSRNWGALPKNLIRGRALLRLLPINKLGVFPGLQINFFK